MKIHFIILAHKNPKQVGKLVTRLISPDSYFYIHIAKGVDIGPFILEIPKNSNSYFMGDSDRVSVAWGDISVVMATLNVIRKICTDKRSGYCVLLSGQDYPLKTIIEIQDFLTENAGKEFINTFSLPTERWENSSLHRLNQYKISFSIKRGDFLLFPSVYTRDFYRRQNFRNLRKLLKSNQRRCIMKIFQPRKFPDYLRPYGGSQWWMLTMKMVSGILQFIQQHPDYLKYHQYTLLPDEIFFQSIARQLYRETPEWIRETVTYVNWHKKNIQLPATLTMEDLSELENLPDTALFARKFDDELCPEILLAMDERAGIETNY